jgi:outer membrane protein OmpA-like peptidoglycan-associated protein
LRAYNEQLSLRRATAVGKVLALAGFGSGQLQLRGLGAAFPVADNANSEGRAENRRVALVIPPQL